MRARGTQKAGKTREISGTKGRKKKRRRTHTVARRWSKGSRKEGSPEKKRAAVELSTVSCGTEESSSHDDENHGESPFALPLVNAKELFFLGYGVLTGFLFHSGAIIFATARISAGHVYVVSFPQLSEQRKRGRDKATGFKRTKRNAFCTQV